MGIEGNEKADREAKRYTRESRTMVIKPTQVEGIVYEIRWSNKDIEKLLRKVIKQLINSINRAEWTFTGNDHNKLHGARKDLMDWKVFRRIMRKHKSREGNSLEENRKWIFKIKCFNRLLPTLDKR